MRISSPRPTLPARASPRPRPRRGWPGPWGLGWLLLVVAGCGGTDTVEDKPGRRAGSGAQQISASAIEGDVSSAALDRPGSSAARSRTTRMQLRMTPARARTCRAWRGQARSASRARGLDPNLLLAIAWVESGFRRRAVSSAGARGPLQLMPRTSRAFGCHHPERPSCAFPAAAALMERLMRRFDGRIHYALCAYNAGAGRIRKAWRQGRLPFNYWYAERVLAAQARLARRGCQG